MEYEIINPSDKAFLTAPDWKSACVAAAILGEGLYGLRRIDGNEKYQMPPIRFATGWFLATFKEDVEEAIPKIGKAKLQKIFASVRLAGERSSLTDIMGRAKELAQLTSG